MKNKKTADRRHLSCELHSNLMLVTTTVAMICFVALMLIYMGMRNSSLPEFTTACSRVSAVAAWAAAAVMAVKAVKRKVSYFTEYIIYLVVMGFGFMFMFNMPVFLYTRFHITNWAGLSIRALTVLTGIFFAVSVVCHGILANRGKK